MVLPLATMRQEGGVSVLNPYGYGSILVSIEPRKSMMSMEPNPVNEYRRHRLKAYEYHPDDILEHYGTEGGIAQEYRERLVYELLQNADDAMDVPTSFDDRVLFRLHDSALLVARVKRAVSEGSNRFHGLRIGGRGRTGLDKLCDPLHEFSSWEALGYPSSKTSLRAESAS